MKKIQILKNIIKKLTPNKEYTFKYIRNSLSEFDMTTSVIRVMLHRLHDQGIITIVDKALFIKEDDDLEINLFIYGSLKRGFINDNILTKAKYISKAVTVRKFAMYKSNNGDYPYLIKNKPLTNIRGELYVVKRKDILARIDAFEDSPEYYTREAINIETRSDKKRAYTYFYTNLKEHKSKVAIEEWTQPEKFDIDTYYKSILKEINE